MVNQSGGSHFQSGAVVDFAVIKRQGLANFKTAENFFPPFKVAGLLSVFLF
jgi:hypothetical protein